MPEVVVSTGMDTTSTEEAVGALGARFGSLQDFFDAMGATRAIHRLLISNNGLAAVKGIDSIRSWLYDHLGDSDAVQFVVMATPEDLKANAEFISMADQHVPVPGGPNRNNYANVDLIIHTALQSTCDAIYPGWGHASENPELPRACEKSKRVTFLGPSKEAMFILGDKIASTIIAQSNGVPTVPWSGSEIQLPAGEYEISHEVYARAYVTTAKACEEVCRAIGFPVMIKASEGGGGKGIRCCTALGQVKEMFAAVSEEVKACHIFVMRMLSNVRHLEVQLLADDYGNCISVRTRDCSVQRRHQKVIEEGPVHNVPRDVVLAMEQAAIRLAKAVHYRGLGTVEYMYDKATHQFYFLELNPRIQVEHPVSELISGVNLPAALFCVGMGVPLHRIPEVRQFYGELPYETSLIDFVTRESLPPRCHTIAVRITAENTDEGFRPTSGRVDEISFKNSKECWGYFSVNSGGHLHAFSDTQFGHIFSSGTTREDARRGMVLALRNLVIRGEIHTSASYLMELLERKEFRHGEVDTAWLDHLIAKSIAVAPNRDGVYLALIAASIHRSARRMQENADRYVAFLSAGHTPSTEYLSNYFTESYVCRGTKYTVSAGRIGASEYALALNGSVLNVPYRLLKSGATQITVGSKTHVAYIDQDPDRIRVTIGNKTTTFTGDVDPTRVVAVVPGRLVRYLVEDGATVREGETFAEIEIMKMILPLRVTTAGQAHLHALPGSTLAVGTLLVTITPEDPSKVKRPTDDPSPWPDELLPDRRLEHADGITRAARAAESLWSKLQGYHFRDVPIEQSLQGIFQDLGSVFLSSVTLARLHLSFLTDSVETEPVVGDVQTPNEKMGIILSRLIEHYAAVEGAFDNATRQEAVEKLRDSGRPQDEIFAIDFAHHQTCHHEVIKSILVYLETNHLLLRSLQRALTCLVELQSHELGPLLLQARYLLRQCLLPSLDERKVLLAKELKESSMEKLIVSSYGYDLLCSIMFDTQMWHLTQVCLEVFIRREYFGDFQIRDLDIYRVESNWYATYRFEPLEEPHRLALDGHAQPEPQAGEEEDGIRTGLCLVIPHSQELRTTLETSLLEILCPGAGEATVCGVFFAVGRDFTQQTVADECRCVLEGIPAALARYPLLATIYFVVHGVREGPYIFTFRRELGFREDELMRNVLPQSARRLELERLANFDFRRCATPYKEVHVFRATPRRKMSSPLESRLFVRIVVTPHGMGLEPWTEATEVDAGHMLSKSLAALEVSRNDVAARYPPSNHIFVKMIQLTFDVRTLRTLLSSVGLSYQQRLRALGVSELELAFPVRTGGGVVGMRVTVDSPTGSGLRIHIAYECLERDGRVCLHPANTAEEVNGKMDLVSTSALQQSLIYDNNNNKPFSPLVSRLAALTTRSMPKLEALQARLPTQQSLDEQGMIYDPELMSHGRAKAVCLAPYPTLRPMQLRRLQARAAGTTFAADWPALLEFILREAWAAQGETKPPPVPLRATQMSLDPADEERLCAVPPQDEAKEGMDEKEDANACGVLVWVVEYAPPAYAKLTPRRSIPEPEKPDGKAPQEAHSRPTTAQDTVDKEQEGDEDGVLWGASRKLTRRFVLVANDLTWQSGSFALREDAMFKAASRLARREGIPFVYISANSGARLGLSEEVKGRFRVAFSEKGVIDYLYLTKTDYEWLRAHQVRVEVEARPRLVQDEERWILLGVVGAPGEYIGVENLRGAAVLAGEMSCNYTCVPTISLVTGRSVGIGAYLNRLGRRVIQSGDAPLILTGANALNRMLGKEVYADNGQLGGRQVMVPNGVTHWNPRDDYGAARVLLRWLDFVPPVMAPAMRCAPRRLFASYACDPIQRAVGFTPSPGQPYDPRWLVTGTTDRPGLFDRGSWVESMAGWAKSVVSGRATLGGLPVGILLVETRTTKRFLPADPADPTSAASFVPQAGQVWFPDSARKTADALEDFHHEQLPCFILANWRGFSGGMRDMFEQVLKFGAAIVDNLRVYTAPVFIYIPPFGELRGGAWVVVDPVINHFGAVEMYCDRTARGNILEPAGMAEVKFREKDLQALMYRSQPGLSELPPKAVREETDRLLPAYRDVAVRFAELHDSFIRLTATGVVRDVVPWAESRPRFYTKLRRKLAELARAQDLVEAGCVPDRARGVEMLIRKYHQHYPTAAAWGVDDAAPLAWLRELSAKGPGWWLDWGGSSAPPERLSSPPLDPKPETATLTSTVQKVAKEHKTPNGVRSRKPASSLTLTQAEQLRRLLDEAAATDGSMERIFAELFEDAKCAAAAAAALRTKKKMPESAEAQD